MAEERRPIPHLTPKGRWDRYVKGIVAETLYVLALCAVGLALAAAFGWAAR